MQSSFKNMRKILHITGGLSLLLLLFTGCGQMADWYIGLPLQPDFLEENYEPGMNIFGVLRPDSTGANNNSFVYIQQVLPAVGDTSSDWEITDAIVEVVSGDPADNLVVPFVIPDQDNIPGRAYYRPEITFTPCAGEVYRLCCHSEGLPVLEGETIIPGQPVISEGSLSTDAHTAEFTVLTDTVCHLLDVYLISREAYYTMRVVPDKQGNTKISFSSEKDISHGTIMIYAYDRHLASYYVTSNVSVNFNKFRKPFSTVQGGYGVFGSLNLLTMEY
jgi:hypothetical protein